MGIVALFKQWIGKFSGNSGETFGSRNGNGNGHGKDVRILCAQCRREFTFEAGEQQFYKMRGLTPPKRCPSCRNKRKSHRR